MVENIDKQLELIATSDDWMEESLDKGKRDKAYQELVDIRRTLKKKKFALIDNPAAAVYGESQVGKSYLISSLLSVERRPFGLVDGKGNFYDFIKDINPIGQGSESTGVVSRFTANYKIIHEDFPIKAVLLSPKDIILLLCDSFYNDVIVRRSDTHNNENIQTLIKRLKDEYSERSLHQTYLNEDHLIDIEEYFDHHFPQKSKVILDNNFFREVSKMINKIEPHKWGEVFSILWNDNTIFTDFFNDLINEYGKINFQQDVFLPIDAILNKQGTILDVVRLKEIYEPRTSEENYQADATILVNESKIKFSKAYLSALTAELVFSQPEDIITNKPFLKDIDLLDFPGARARMHTSDSDIKKESLSELLIRGKVGYLFNKYSTAEKINILLFCTKHEQTGQRIIPNLLNNWIKNTIGQDSVEREGFVIESKISPLFIIGTFFNINLEYNNIKDTFGNNDSLSYRWEQRFIRTLESEYIQSKDYSWFTDWTTSQKYFQNIYLLRDFYESSEGRSNIFKGYQSGIESKEIEEIVPIDYPDFMKDLKKSFLDYNFVKKHFSNPEKSWDAAATLNNDGSELIIQNLNIAAQNINKARNDKFIKELNQCNRELLEILNRYFYTENKDKEVIKAKRTVGEIQLELNTVFAGEGIKNFGSLIKSLMLTESEVLNIVKSKIDDIKSTELQDNGKYITYRMNFPKLNAELSLDENLEYIRQNIGFESKEEVINWFTEKRIDVEELIYGGNNIQKYSEKLVENLISSWAEKVKANSSTSIFTLSSDKVDEIIEMYLKLFKKFAIKEEISNKINRYVDGFKKVELAYEMIADISAEIINKCISEIGLHYYSESDLHDLQETNKRNNLGLNIADSTIKLAIHYNPRIELAALFSGVDELNDGSNTIDKITRLPHYKNFKLWYNRLKIGFISVCDIPNYNIEANDKLGKIISEVQNVEF